MHQLLYIACSDRAEAEALAKHLLEAKLVACANLLPEITSFYRWEGAMQQAGEIILLAKSQKQHFGAIETLIKTHHSYDCPCLLAFDITQGHAPFLDWISEETSSG